MKIWNKKHYEAKFDTDPKTVDDYYVIIAEAQARIIKLQSECKHPEVELMFFSWRPGDLQPSKVCKTCHSRVGDASPEESQKMWDKFHNEHSSY